MIVDFFHPKKLLVACLFLLLSSTFATAAGTRIESVLASGASAEITFADSPIKTMTETPFSIKLHKASGEVIDDAVLALSLTMPFMQMPPNKPKAAWDKGTYKGIAVFTMAGAWQVNVEVERPDTDKEIVIFDIEMVIMK